MYQINETYCGNFENKGSKFLSFLTPYKDFEPLLHSLKIQHPKAVHYVYATRVYQSHIIESFSDDGEPKGSSGIPTLNVLRGEDLIDVGLIIVRYFGGTLLGVGGLVRAYTKSAQDAIQQAKNNGGYQMFVQKVQWEIVISYPHLRQVEYFCKHCDINIIDKNFQAQEVGLKLESTQEKKLEFEVFITQNQFGCGRRI
ncbi:YigZ family protein [Helicobacter enhydrae]|uniref:YigZ family protein n=1 Tax=Helicobacter enhydrae TaxID=222136 RepID=UPI000A077605|nr:YigZ family protein [Helicobacter enhydrae]